MPSTRLKLTLAALAVSAAIGGAWALGPAQPPVAQMPPPAVATPVLLPAPIGYPDMRSIVAANGPAVVNISVTGKRTENAAGFPQLDPSDPFYHFFRQFRGMVPRESTPTRGLGSGFIISPDGLVMTNAHVVADADEVVVKLTDKREFKARILGQDKASDVALLRIEGQNLPTVRIGNSRQAQVGDWVLAIGSPFGFESSASAGIISAKSRSLPDGSYVPFLQTDVAVNPGNSGGPLFNMQGEVIGINSQIYSRSGGFQGLSFAIPIELAMNVQQQIVKHGKVERGRIGITIQEVDQSLADSFGLPRPAGALVTSVDKDGPAGKAGLEAGDVILGIDGETVEQSGELPAIVAAKRPGENVRLQVWRNRAARDLTVQVGAFEEEKTASAASPELGPNRLGVAVRPLTPEEKRRTGSSGNLVVERAGGPAARAGIRPGDIIVSVNGQAVSDADKLNAALAQSGKRAAILIERGNTRLFVPVELS